MGMKSLVVACAGLFLLLVSVTPALSLPDGELSGKALHDRDCTGCHGPEMYQRENLFVKDYRQLVAQVEYWLKKNGIDWSEEQKDEVLDYLAEEFYDF